MEIKVKTIIAMDSPLTEKAENLGNYYGSGGGSGGGSSGDGVSSGVSSGDSGRNSDGGSGGGSSGGSDGVGPGEAAKYLDQEVGLIISRSGPADEGWAG